VTVIPASSSRIGSLAVDTIAWNWLIVSVRPRTALV
jgi:hypothetical protein